METYVVELGGGHCNTVTVKINLTPEQYELLDTLFDKLNNGFGYGEYDPYIDVRPDV